MTHLAGLQKKTKAHETVQRALNMRVCRNRYSMFHEIRNRYSILLTSIETINNYVLLLLYVIASTLGPGLR